MTDINPNDLTVEQYKQARSGVARALISVGQSGYQRYNEVEPEHLAQAEKLIDNNMINLGYVLGQAGML